MTGQIDWELYEQWLGATCTDERKTTINAVVESVLNNIENNPSYQVDATRNGESQPIIATRKSTKKCKVTVIPGSEMHIGDLVSVFNENWLCMEAYTDEYGITYGELWMCNHIFRFQNKTPEVIKKYGIIDDGSYSSSSDSLIMTPEGKYVCYISRDEASTGLYVDKRLAIDAVLNSDGEQIIEVGKITWIDNKSCNYGDGSHLITFRIEGDVYNPETDNVGELVCDFIKPEDSTGVQEKSGSGYIFVFGRDAARIGTSRTYEATVIDDSGNNKNYEEFQWVLHNAPAGVTITANGAKCLLVLPLDEKIIGSTIKLVCEDKCGLYAAGNKEVAVITIG